ncbi:MAG: hypothetical protein EBQ56_00780, partial [Proteobacteria bacterium]|nr:hypothetical protein [Pseudomonadota bacterium]
SVGTGVLVTVGVSVGTGVLVTVGVSVGVDVSVGVSVGDDVDVSVGVAVFVGVFVGVDVGVFEEVDVGVAVGATMVRFNCWVVLTVSAAPAALVKARFENVIFDVPTTKPLSERVSTWTVPVWPLALLVVRLTR